MTMPDKEQLSNLIPSPVTAEGSPGVRLLIFLLLIAALEPRCVSAEALEMLLEPPAQPPAAGATMVFSVYYHNSGDRPVAVAVAQVIACHLTAGGRTTEINARRVSPAGSGTVSIHPQGFAKARFELRLPDDIQGTAHLTAPGLQDAGFYFEIREDRQAQKESGAWIPRTTDEPLDALTLLYQPYVKNISFYEPMYFLVGSDPKYSKFQLSLKYRLFNPEKPFARKRQWLQGFHFGYTQTSFWDLASDSAPFEDTSYKPEIFYITTRLKTKVDGLDGLFLKSGLRHESNGQGGVSSRSTNTAYIEPIFIFYNSKRRTGLKVAPRLWTYFGNEDANNPDLEKYRGYFDLGVTFGKAEGAVVDTTFWWAAKGASVQVNITYPLHTLVFSDLDLYFQVQYVNRLAEGLLNYTERTEAVRLGFAIVR